MNEDKTMPNVYIIAGPNGAGKTTFANQFLPRSVAGRQFINADLIAKGISPFAPDSVALEAGRVMLERIEQLHRQRVDFALESTLAARTLTSRLESMEQSGYRIHIVYLWLETPELAVARVAERVREGGHSVPDATIRRRYLAGLRNFFKLYLPLAHFWALYDNSSDESLLVAFGDRDGSRIEDPSRYEFIERMVGE